jgi:hypothetical protein
MAQALLAQRNSQPEWNHEQLEILAQRLFACGESRLRRIEAGTQVTRLRVNLDSGAFILTRFVEPVDFTLPLPNVQGAAPTEYFVQRNANAAGPLIYRVLARDAEAFCRAHRDAKLSTLAACQPD